MRNAHLILLTAALGLAGTACSDDVTNPVAPSTVAAVTTSQSEHSSSWSRERRGNTVVVSPRNMRGWGFLQETPNGTGHMENGPGRPPAGRGSANLIVDATGGMMIGAALYGGTPLSEIRHLRYSTHRTFGAPPVAISLQFNFDKDLADANNDFQGRLVYEPYHSGHVVLTGVWQRWNTLDNAPLGNWWITPRAGTAFCPQANPCTWAEVLAAFPRGGVWRQGGILLKVGSGGGAFDGNTDALTIQVGNRRTTYDFELRGRGGKGNDSDDDDDDDDDGDDD